MNLPGDDARATEPMAFPVGPPPRPTAYRSPLSRVLGRIAVVRRYGVPVLSEFVKDSPTNATVFLSLRGKAMVGKYFVDTPEALAEFAAEQLSTELFSDQAWRMPVERWGKRHMLVRRLPDESRMDVRARTMSAQERGFAAAWALDVLLEIYLAGYLHGDLQPHNIWYLDGRPVVTDWSTFSARTADVSFTESADITGHDQLYSRRFDPAFDPNDPWSFHNAMDVSLTEATAVLERRLVAESKNLATARRKLMTLRGQTT